MTLHLSATHLGLFTHVRPILLIVGVPLCAGFFQLARRSRNLAWMTASVAMTIFATAASVWFMFDPHLKERWQLRQLRRRRQFGHCPHCGHDLVEDVHTCPECRGKL
jgi:hypothetical protein